MFTQGGATARRMRHAASRPGRITRVAVSGGIGSGKSTLAYALKPWALAFADADQIARDIVAPGEPALQQIAQRFGAGVIGEDGSLDRAALAGLVFADARARFDLEGITHPRIAQRAHEILSTPEVNGVAGPGFVLYDVPLVRTYDEASVFDEVVMVTAPLEDRLERLVERGVSRDDALARINAQVSDEERESLATIVVANEGSVADLEAVARHMAGLWTTQEYPK